MSSLSSQGQEYKYNNIPTPTITHESQGKSYSLNLASGYCSFGLDKPKEKRRPRISSSTPKAENHSMESSEAANMRSSRLRRNNLTKGLSRVDEKEATVFVTLIFPFERVPEKSKAVEWCKGKFKNFERRIKRRYPDCWFIKSWELHSNGIPHIHILGNPGPSTDLNEFGAFVTKAWHQIFNFYEHRDNLVDTRKARPEHRGYLVSNNKKAMHVRLVALFGRSRTWGFINKDNVPFTALTTGHLSESKVQQVREVLMEVVREQASHRPNHEMNQDFMHRLAVSDYIFVAFIPPWAAKEIQEIIEAG